MGVFCFIKRPGDRKKDRRTTDAAVELQRLGIEAPTGDAAASRVVHINPPPEATARTFGTNSVRTAKYNVVTFLPRYLFEQFSQVAYFYFLIQACLVWWGTVSPFKPFGPVLALVFVLVVGALKALAEDRRRHIEDNHLNNSITHVLHPDGGTTDVKWKDVKVGQVLKVMSDEDFPADLLCLHCDLPDNVCYIKTTNLDGETNLKVRRPLNVKGEAPQSPQEAMAMHATLACEPPNSNLHYFIGRTVVQAGDRRETVAVTMNEILLRGCTLKNSGFVVGLVVYTGPESRIQMNAAAPPSKQGSYTRFLNMQVIIVIVLQILLCAACSAGALAWRENIGKKRYYLALDNTAQGNYSSNVAFYFVYMITYWLLFSYLVPISLFVTIEIVKFVQGNFINNDPDMRVEGTDDWAKARNSNIIEDLGRVAYVFSDKTGTLTSNEMRMRAVAIKGVPYGGTGDFRLEDFEGKGDAALKAFAPRLHSAAGILRRAGVWDEAMNRGGSSPNLLKLTRTESNTPPETLGLARRGNEQVSTRELLLGHHVMDFWTAICVCHNLIVEGHDSTGEGDFRYQGPSPDEVALVEGARQLGFEFIGRTRSQITISFQGHRVTHDVLVELEFSSDRARMSVVARSPDGTIRLLCKGSDAVMLPRLRAGTDEKLLADTQENLHAFSVKGLRTLVIATKVLEAGEWEAWHLKYEQAASSLDDREARIAAAAEQLEVQMELLGVTAIEDKLQEGVPEAIETLIEGGMRVWMITGDKQETAINIGISAGLVSDASRCLICNAEGVDAASKKLNELHDQLRHQHGGAPPAPGGSTPPPGGRGYQQLSAAESAAGKTASGGMSDGVSGSVSGSVLGFNGTNGTNGNGALAKGAARHGGRPELVIDGATLGFILGTPAEQQLAAVAAGCASVIVCRASPSQKAAVVRMMTQYEDRVAEVGARTAWGRWLRRYRRRMAFKMLSIGDGANDVAMIQTADIGVGIMGKEGRQAVNNSDYAIGQFRFLVRLLMVHGTLSVYRLARLIRYSFYKNIALAFLLFYFQIFAGWSGQSLLDGITTSFYNAFFTAFPIGFFAVLDRPFRHLHTYVRFPKMYNVNNPLSVRTFWKTGVLMGIAHSAAVFFIIYYSSVASDRDSTNDLYSVGKVMFVALIGIVSAELGMLARFWTWEFSLCALVSYCLIYAYLFALPALQEAFDSKDPATYGVAQQLFGSPLFWLQLIAVTAVCVGTRYLDRAMRQAFYPNDQQIVAEAEKLPHGGAPHTATRLQRLSSAQPPKRGGTSAIEPLPTSDSRMQFRPGSSDDQV
mmetsp:Transcript_7573/g.22355  ORF Transcript_7573/g.22355 Transcript_7573/m.22355 type:complete len:1298 (+) Transcript_7573:304-4197(+)